MMVYSGSLQPKKKSELQDIANALRISDQGTKDDIQTRIRKHLDDNQDTLEDDPRFANLFARRKRSVAPPSSRQPESDKPRLVPRRVAALDPVKESSPPKDLREVSLFLKSPEEQDNDDATPPPAEVEAPITPSSLPPLPSSPIKSLIQRIPIPNKDEFLSVAHVKQQEILDNGSEFLISLRAFLSNSRNIWSLTALVELFYILSVIIPWDYFQFTLPTRPAPVSVIYPPYTVLQTSAFWKVLLHWSIPTLIIPAVVGSLISFTPTSQARPAATFDPLTASIIRLAVQLAYPYQSLASNTGVVGIDVLGSNWRIWSASVNVAFAFAEAIAGAPQVFAKTFIHQQRNLIEGPSASRPSTPSRRLLTARGQEHEEL